MSGTDPRSGVVPPSGTVTLDDSGRMSAVCSPPASPTDGAPTLEQPLQSKKPIANIVRRIESLQFTRDLNQPHDPSFTPRGPYWAGSCD